MDKHYAKIEVCTNNPFDPNVSALLPVRLNDVSNRISHYNYPIVTADGYTNLISYNDGHTY